MNRGIVKQIRVSPDEPEYIAMSKALYLRRIPTPPGMTYVDLHTGPHENLIYTKRPAGYPFLISLLHDFFGYKLENAYYLNRVFGVGCLMLVFLFFLPAGLFVSMCASLSLVSHPILTICSNNAGVEIGFLFLFLTFLYLIRIYSKYKMDSIFNAAWLTLLCLPYFRLEALALVCAGFVLVPLLRIQPIQTFAANPIVGASALLISPLFWQRTSLYTIPHKQVRIMMSPDFFLKHLEDFTNLLIRNDFVYSGGIFIASLLILIWIPILNMASTKKFGSIKPIGLFNWIDSKAVIIGFSLLLIETCVLLSVKFAHPAWANSMRYYLIVCGFSSLIFTEGLRILIDHRKHNLPLKGLILVVLCVLCLHSHNICMKANTKWLGYRKKINSAILKATIKAGQAKPNLYIFDYLPYFYDIHNQYIVRWSFALENSQRIKNDLGAGKFENAYVLKKYGKREPSTQLLEKVFELGPGTSKGSIVRGGGKKVLVKKIIVD